MALDDFSFLEVIAVVTSSALLFLEDLTDT